MERKPNRFTGQKHTKVQNYKKCLKVDVKSPIVRQDMQEQEDPGQSPKGLPLESLEEGNLYSLELPEEEILAKLVKIQRTEDMIQFAFKPEGRGYLMITYIPKFKVILPMDYDEMVVKDVESNPQGGRKKRRTLKKKKRTSRKRRTSKLH
jgi:hypothetical protein